MPDRTVLKHKSKERDMNKLTSKVATSAYKGMKPMNSVKIVEEFWAAVCQARNPAAIDDFVVDDFVIATGGIDIVSKDKFREWACAFMQTINDLRFEVLETFQTDDGTRAASRWRITGKNNGLLGTTADQKPIPFTGTAIWAVREDGKLLHN
jgi:SnoaL-like protein